MELLSLSKVLSENSYPGRGIVLGMSEDGKYAAAAYFIMGRSVNSRNRIFVTEGEDLKTQAHDPSKMEDPSLIIYSPVRVLDDYTIITNGDQTDTIYEGMKAGKCFMGAQKERTFEPDAPNYTPRISGLMHVENGKYDYRLSILKTDEGRPECTVRQLFAYDTPFPGEGRFIHTYIGDGNPLPSFSGEPERVDIKGNLDDFTDLVWNSLNSENKVSLFTRFIEIATNKAETRIVNINA